MSERFGSFVEFWPFYVREHSKPLTRWFHYAGTAGFLACMATLARTRKLRYLPLGAVAGYGPAWISHYFIEKNTPATFKYPLWSLLADFKMFELMSRGLMDAEVARVMSTQSGSNGHAGDAAHADSHDARDQAN